MIVIGNDSSCKLSLSIVFTSELQTAPANVAFRAPAEAELRGAVKHLFDPRAAVTFARDATSFQGTDEAHGIAVLRYATWHGIWNILKL